MAFAHNRRVVYHHEEEHADKRKNQSVERLGENVYDAYADCIRANNGEGILKYQFYKPETGEWLNKISFIKLYEPLGWVIGTGVYEDYIDELVADKTQALNNRISTLVEFTIIIGVLLILIATVVLYYFGNSITQPIKMIETQLYQMSQGLMVKKLTLNRSDEIGQMKKSLDALIDGFASYAGFARQIGIGTHRPCAQIVHQPEGDRAAQFRKQKFAPPALARQPADGLQKGGKRQYADFAHVGQFSHVC